MTARAPDHVLCLTIASTPPSVNKIPYTFGSAVRDAAAPLKRRIIEVLEAADLPRDLTRAEASAVLAFPVQRCRAAGNYAPVLERALADALVEVGWLSAPEQFTLDALTFEQAQSIATTVELRGWEASRP